MACWFRGGEGGGWWLAGLDEEKQAVQGEELEVALHIVLSFRYHGLEFRIARTGKHRLNIERYSYDWFCYTSQKKLKGAQKLGKKPERKLHGKNPLLPP